MQSTGDLSRVSPVWDKPPFDPDMDPWKKMNGCTDVMLMDQCQWGNTAKARLTNIYRKKLIVFIIKQDFDAFSVFGVNDM